MHPDRKIIKQSFARYSLLSADSDDDKTCESLKKTAEVFPDSFILQLSRDAIRKNKIKTLAVLLTKKELSDTNYLPSLVKELIENKSPHGLDQMKVLLTDSVARDVILDHVDLRENSMDPSADMMKLLSRTLLQNFDKHYQELYEAWYKSPKHQAHLGQSITHFLLGPRDSYSYVKGIEILEMLSGIYRENLPIFYKILRARMYMMLGEHQITETLLLNLNKSVDVALYLALNALHDANASPTEICKYHKELAMMLSKDKPHFQLNTNDKTPDRKLKIGIVIEPLYDQHVVYHFMGPFLAANEKEYEIVFYDCSKQPDQRTIQHLQQHHQIIQAGDFKPEQLVTEIRKEKIDILFDLSGYLSTENIKLRIPSFAAHPAPLQMTYIAYPNTTGLPSMDYRLVDRVTDPEQKTDPFYTETLLRLDNSFLCYTATPQKLESKVETASPSTQKGYVALGILNDPRKLSDAFLVDLSSMLNKIPNSKLCFQFGDAWSHPESCQYFFEKIKKYSGISSEELSSRIIFYPQVENRIDWISREIDIAVDSYPYNGTTTNFDMLLACVPIVTQAMIKRHEGNVTASLLTHLDLPELKQCITTNSKEFVECVARLAEDVALRDSLRAGNRLREHLLASSICNVEQYTEKFWHSMRQTWRQFCDVDLKAQIKLENPERWNKLTDEQFCARIADDFPMLFSNKHIEEIYLICLLAIVENKSQATVMIFQNLPSDYQTDVVETLFSLNAMPLIHDLILSPAAKQFNDALMRTKNESAIEMMSKDPVYLQQYKQEDAPHVSVSMKR